MTERAVSLFNLSMEDGHSFRQSSHSCTTTGKGAHPESWRRHAICDRNCGSGDHRARRRFGRDLLAVAPTAVRRGHCVLLAVSRVCHRVLRGVSAVTVVGRTYSQATLAMDSVSGAGCRSDRSVLCGRPRKLDRALAVVFGDRLHVRLATRSDVGQSAPAAICLGSNADGISVPAGRLGGATAHANSSDSNLGTVDHVNCVYCFPDRRVHQCHVCATGGNRCRGAGWCLDSGLFRLSRRNCSRSQPGVCSDGRWVGFHWMY